jgi:N-acetylornithine carbamoyltransferase
MSTVTAPPRPDLLHGWDLSDEEFAGLLAMAEILAGPAGKAPLLAGRRAAALFLAPSLRTRVSFEAACQDLGAHPVVVTPGHGTWGFEHRDGVVMDGDAAEHIAEAVPVLGTMVDALALRAFASLADVDEDRRDAVLAAVASASSVPVLNLESAMDHPHQGLADALCLRRAFGDEKLKVALTWAPHMKPLPRAVPHAAVTALVRDGHDVVLCHPPGFDLDPGVLEQAGSRAGSLTVTHDRAQALDGAQVVYAKSWGRPDLYGDSAAGAAAVAAHTDWRVTADDLADGARFMHCLPVRRGVVVDADVLDSPASLVVDQAGCRLPVQKATLCRALGVQP